MADRIRLFGGQTESPERHLEDRLTDNELQKGLTESPEMVTVQTPQPAPQPDQDE
jgi:hypothetical protein